MTAGAAPRAERRVSVVVLTHERLDELGRCLDALSRLPERPALIVVDNASRDGSAEYVARCHPDAELVRCTRNLGAAGRNAGVARVRTPYVAFCDDDTWWAERRARARGRSARPPPAGRGDCRARVLVGTDERDDPTCAAMAASPLGAAGLPGPALVSFMAGAVVMRTAAFRDAGGYEPRLFLGAEEALLGMDLLAAGWHIVYAREVVTHHHPSLARDRHARRVMLARNRIWLDLAAPAVAARVAREPGGRARRGRGRPAAGGARPGTGRPAVGAAVAPRAARRSRRAAPARLRARRDGPGRARRCRLGAAVAGVTAYFARRRSSNAISNTPQQRHGRQSGHDAGGTRQPERRCGHQPGECRRDDVDHEGERLPARARRWRRRRRVRAAAHVADAP